MKKLLLAGVATLTVASVAGSAQAQSKFEVRMGGDAYFQAGFVGQDRDAGLRGSEFRERFRLNTLAIAKTDNGLEYGARLRIRAATNAAVDNDRAYIFIGGGFGTFAMGTINGVSDEYGVLGPVVGWGTYGGPDGNWLDFLAGSSTANELPTGAAGSLRTLNGSVIASRITYASPEFSGLKFVASYGPNMNSSGQDVSRIKNDGSYQDVYEVGLVYSREFSDIGVDASLFYEGGEVSAANTDDLSSWAAGLQFSYMGFSIGGSYAYAGDSGYTSSDPFKADQETYILGAQYETGPVVLGVAYTRSEDAGSTAVAGDRTLDLYQAGVNYTVAPGLTIGAEYSHFKLDTDTVNADDEGDMLILQTYIEF